MLAFDEAAHAYTFSGQPVPGVTSVLKPLYDFARVDPDVLAAKASLGQSVHLACELDDANDLDESSVGAVTGAYLEGYRQFKRDKRPEVVASEQRVYHPGMRYAGTLDALLRVDGALFVVDFKTTATLSPAVGVQLEAYRMALGDAGIGARRAALRLTLQGTYQFHEFKDPQDWPCFVSLLTLYRWKEKNRV